MFIVSLPYAVYHGGYWAILAMVGIAYICCYTGKILVDCLYETDEFGETKKVRYSYNDIAQEVFGKRFGGKIINAAQLIELLMTCILYIVLCGDLLIGAFPYGQIDTRSYMMICGLLLLPCAFLKNLQHVSKLSFWNGVVHTLINVLILGYCILRAQDWAFSKVTLKVDILSFPIALGIIVFSYTSQIFLPTLEENMIDKSKFHCMLHWSHIAAAIFKALFGYLGFLTWQEDTQEVIVNNIDGFFKLLVNMILVIKALLSYPLPFYAACDLIEGEMFRGKPDTMFPSIWGLDGNLKIWGLAFRVGIIVGTIGFAVIIPHFSILMGFIGNFTGCLLSFVWPCIFHLYIRRKSMSWYTMLWDIFIILLGCMFALVGMYYSGKALFKAYELGMPV
jgi:vesicular inhibitory amino acid transporter